MKKCSHVWKWVAPRIVLIGSLFRDLPEYSAESYNVECEKCGAHTWAHRGGAA